MTIDTLERTGSSTPDDVVTYTYDATGWRGQEADGRMAPVGDAPTPGPFASLLPPPPAAQGACPMSIAKRNSRTIVVDGVRYRWACSESSRDLPATVVVGDESLGRINLVIENDEGPSSQIRLSEIQRLMTHSRPERAITPRLVRRVIEYAIAVGWTPQDGDLELTDSLPFAE